MYLRYVLSAAAIFYLAGAAKADYSLEFANSSGVVQTSFIGNSGTSLTIQVYLLQTSAGSGAEVLGTNGLSAAGTQLNFSSGAFTVSTVSSNTPQFGFFTTGGSSTTASVVESSSTAVLAPSSGANANRILLGTFTFTLNSTGNITTSFPGSGANDVDGLGNTLDGLVSQGSATVYVISVPEPGSMILSGLAGSLIAVGAWRRRRKTLATQIA